MAREQDFPDSNVYEITGEVGEGVFEDPIEGHPLEEQADILRQLIQRYASEMRKFDKPVKMTAGDLIRVFQFQRELMGDKPAELIEVRWVTQKHDEEG